MQAQIHPFFDEATWTFSYVVYDQVGGHAAVVDPVLDYDPKSGRTASIGADRIIQYLRDKNLKLSWILETHAHADHLSAAHYLREQCGGQIGIGARIHQVQEVFQTLFHLGDTLKVDGSQFDHLFHDGEQFQVGALTAQVIAVPGHTPADIAYQFGQAVFVGDTLFMPDVGTARCDFPGGSAHDLYQSIQKLFAMPADTVLYMCHDYPPNEREPAWQTTVAAQRTANIHVHDGVSEASFIDLRNKRDATLQMPALIIPSIQINIRAGEFPAPEENGVSYLKMPLNLL